MHWKLALGSALPAAFSAAYLVPSVYLTLAYPMVFAPVIYGLYDAKKVNKSFQTEVLKMYLLENGNQMLLQTCDGLLHKVNILDNHKNEFAEAKDGSLIFVMINNGRRFTLTTKDAKEIDYDLLDRIVRAITVDTGRSQQVYHH